MPEKPKFCLDTNSFAEPARRFYPFDFASSYWDWLASLGETAWISVLEVYEEILEGEGEDSLKRWVKQNRHFFKELDEDAQRAFVEIKEYVETCYCSNKAHEFFARQNNKDNADPYVIAMAKAKGLVVVTFETPVGDLRSTLKGQKYNAGVKIPDVCRYFGIPCVDLFRMLRELGITLTIG